MVFLLRNFKVFKWNQPSWSWSVWNFKLSGFLSFGFFWGTDRNLLSPFRLFTFWTNYFSIITTLSLLPFMLLWISFFFCISSLSHFHFLSTSRVKSWLWSISSQNADLIVIFKETATAWVREKKQQKVKLLL